MASKKSKGKHHIDVRSGSDIMGLNELLKSKKNNTIIVLVYADFCGHCTTFKNDVWKQLGSMPNRNAGLASIHYDQVENTPFAGKTINGYPTVFALKKGMTPEKAEEVKDIRNIEMMKSLAEGEKEEEEEEVLEEIQEAKNADVKEEAELLNNLSNKKYNRNNNSNSLPLNTKSQNLRNSAKKTNVVSLLNEATGSITKPVSIPDYKSDMLNSQVKTISNSVDFNPSESTETKSKSKEIVGGSLYASLLEASKLVAPAAILTGAVVLSKKRRATKRKHKKKTSKRSRKSRN